jgi:hypothetical protein
MSLILSSIEIFAFAFTFAYIYIYNYEQVRMIAGMSTSYSEPELWSKAQVANVKIHYA